MSELAARLVPVYEQAYRVESSGDTKAILKKHIEDTLRLGMEQGRRTAVQRESGGTLSFVNTMLSMTRRYFEIAKSDADPVRRKDYLLRGRGCKPA
ncbi:MAG: hypothetical protein V4760_04835 [Bdellovibrionota bacterium]